MAMDGQEPMNLAARGVPLVATPARWLVATGLLVGAMIAALAACLAFAHSHKPLSSFAAVLSAAAALIALFVWLSLGAEEARLGRELRTARAGTAAVRASLAARRRTGTLLTPLLSTPLGTAAVLLAQGERSSAVSALAGRKLLMEGGHLDALRAVVTADLDRDLATPAALDQSIRALSDAPRIGNREADLYRTHVLVKAILERGDPERALDLLPILESSSEGEERVYAVWLRVWFDLDGESEGGGGENGTGQVPLSEGDLRLATLLARAHGAEKLVDKLGERLAAIARPLQGE
jgi:hypothetical protein